MNIIKGEITVQYRKVTGFVRDSRQRHKMVMSEDLLRKSSLFGICVIPYVKGGRDKKGIYRNGNL